MDVPTQITMQSTSNVTSPAQVAPDDGGLFVSGWRPAIGWVCAGAFAWRYLIQPALVFAFSAIGHPVPLPTLDDGTMDTVLLGMLGLGAARTTEKIMGVAPKAPQ